mmetsp:Transcript_61479/g.191032  ORF Transcript_61479/g.191032 Transcript_61479/m.191032 type:complete len:116 (+) Transcript_61479:3-350(+)
MGCRRRVDALPHGERLQAFLQDGVLQRLSIAESRPGSGAEANRRLVQDALREDAEEVGARLYPCAGEQAEGAMLLVCGGAAMGSSVREVVAGIATALGGSIEGLEGARRYVAELW